MIPVSVVTTTDGLIQRVQAGSHTVVADAEAALGGTDRGPAPHDFVAVALCSCSAMTMQMYAKRKGWPIGGIEVHVEPEKAGSTTVFKRRIHFPAEMSAEQKTRLLDIADKCPVHKMLSGEIRIQTVES